MLLDVLEMGKISVKKHTHSRVETDPWLGFNKSSLANKEQSGCRSGRWLSYR